MSDVYPIGAIAAFAGAGIPDSAKDSWVLCDGSQCTLATQPQYQALFDVIGYTYGQKGEGIFCLPDYRGQFLRGADRKSGNDPDARLRRRQYETFPGTDGTRADPVGDAVGTTQEDALARPQKAFTALLPHLPQSAKSTAYTIGSPPHASSWKGGKRAIQTNLGGGDDETRPINAYVHYYIKYGNGA